MFRLHKSGSSKAASKSSTSSGEKIDFRFSHFKALRVPKGWDRLFVSIISLETGKVVAKLSKASVRSGSCQWNETLTESVSIPTDDEASKELEPGLFRLIVAMGSARSGILGECTVDLARYMSSPTSVPVSFDLKKCNHGSTLQFKIQCLTPRTKLRDDEINETKSQKEDIKADSCNVEIKSDDSEDKLVKSEEPYSSRDSGSITHLEKYKRKEDGSHSSYHSMDGAVGTETFSNLNNIAIGGTEPSGSNEGDDNLSQSNHSSFISRITHSENLSEQDQQEFAAPALRISSSSKRLLEAAEDTIEDLRREAKMWERNARKFMLDLDVLKKEYTDQSKSSANLDRELSVACAERDSLQKEVEKLKLLLESSVVKPAVFEVSTIQGEGTGHVVKELENEIKFQKESNASLTLQLKRSHDSNIELVSVLQELEDTIEKQKAEIENLSALQSKVNDMENSIQENLEKNKNLVLQIENLQGSEKVLRAKVHALEQALEDKNQKIENWRLNNQTLLEKETEYRRMLSAKENETVSLKAKLSEFTKEGHSSAEAGSTYEGDENLVREIEELKSQLQELEADCQELTDENLGLLLKLKETKNNATEECLSFLSSKSEASDHDSQMHILEEKLRKKLLKQIENQYILSIQELQSHKMELEVKVAELNEELSERKAEIGRLEIGLHSKEEEIQSLQRYQQELEAKLSVLRKDKEELEESAEILKRESDIAAKCLNDLQKDLMVLSSSIDSHVSANKVLERKSSELESSKCTLELRLLELGQEIEELLSRISGLEAQISTLTDERMSTESELENSRSHVLTLQGEIARLTDEMGMHTTDMQQKMQEMHDQLSEAQEELKNLRSENPKLQATAENLTEACSSLQQSNEDLKRQNLELQEHCTEVEAKLRESDRNVADCTKRVKALEENISSMVAESVSKEKNVTSELNALLEENGNQNKKLNWLNRVHLEKMTEIQNLQRELADLTDQLSATQAERDRMAANAAQEISGLHANVARLESVLNAAHVESEVKINGLSDELATCKKDQERLKADNRRMSMLLASYKSCEDNLKTSMNGLELKLTVSEYERQQLVEESTYLKVQSLKIGSLGDEVLALKNELNMVKSEKAKLQTSLRITSGECKNLKVEKESLVNKITSLQNAASELEDCKESRIGLQKKLLQMEGELMEKQALCEQEAELKSELTRVKRANKQLQQQTHQLEEEKNKFKTRVQSLEDELVLEKEQQSRRKSGSLYSYINQSKKEGDNEYESHPAEVDSASIIRLLEDQLAKATEENNGYRVQLKRLSSNSRRTHTGSPKKSGELVSKERFERTKSSLETELRDLRERYLHMSLKYAEVEGEREDLVMKLKAANSGKRWQR